jgi:hypothetical protein
VVARLGDTPPFPEPGIYFGMPEEEYHAIPALSSSGIKKLAASPMIFWAGSWLNPEKDAPSSPEEREKERVHQRLGKAYHCRLLEGAAAFADRWCVGLDKADYPDAIESVEEIKAAIEKAGHIPVTKIATGEEVPDPKKAGAMKPVLRTAKKEDWIAQLQEIDLDVQIWPIIQSEFAQANAGKGFVTAEQYKRIAIAAAMIERDDELSRMVGGGHAEVSLFWVCPITGVPMKMRADYLKVRSIIDLKTVANQKEMSFERAITSELASRKYGLQPSVYGEGAAAVRQLVREHGASAVHVLSGDVEEATAWALKWAQHREPDEFFFIFQQKGIAPITRGLRWPRMGTTKMIFDDIVKAQKRRFREFNQSYGVDPWLDLKPVYDLADEDLPPYATDI